MGDPSTTSPPRPGRLESVDLLRGVVMVIMALDHVRDFWWSGLMVGIDPVNPSQTTVPLFFTRWITHYCAPTFIFLAGTSAFLMRSRGKSRAELAWFLFTRGLWLAFFEAVINRFFWIFSFDFHVHGAGVFWAIGWSMVVLSWLVFLPTWAVTAFGVVMITLHNAFDPVTAQQLHLPDWLWGILHAGGKNPVVQDVTFETGYCLIPWMGVMAAGYGFGSILQLDPAARRQRLLHLGATLTLLFFIVRLANVYGDLHPWTIQRSNVYTFLSFLNCHKYPPSLCYLLMTLGPAILFLAIFDRPLGPIAKPIIVFGRVPMFYYILHIPLIHGGAVLYDYIAYGWSPLIYPYDPQTGRSLPENYGFGLPMIYAIWIIVLLILYPLCRWYAGVKQRHRDNVWLSYL
ncbi:MAG: DUF1624 domain-containing protein [Gemmataceae bacterium]